MDKAIDFLYEVKQGAYCDNSTVTMTLDVYAHPSDKRQREVVGGIQERFRGLAKGEEKQGQ